MGRKRGGHRQKSWNSAVPGRFRDFVPLKTAGKGGFYIDLTPHIDLTPRPRISAPLGPCSGGLYRRNSGLGGFREMDDALLGETHGDRGSGPFLALQVQ